MSFLIIFHTSDLLLDQARDPFSNNRTAFLNPSRANQPPHPVFNVTLTMNHLSSSSSTVQVANLSTYVSDGMYFIGYNATQAGVYNLTIRDGLTGELVQGCPFHPYIRPAAGDPLQSVLSGTALSVATAGAVSNVYLQSFDRFGNHLDRGGDLILATLLSPCDCREPPCIYPGSSSPAGASAAAIAQDDLPLGQLPTIPTVTNAQNKGVFGSMSDLYSGSSDYYRPFDGLDTNRVGESPPIAVTDHGNGSYSLPYIAPRAGKHVLQVKMGVSGGLWATYYRSIDFRSPFEGRKEGVTLGFNLTWGPNGPVEGAIFANTSIASHEAFSVIFRGFLQIPQSGVYQFWTATDVKAEVRIHDII